MMNIYTIGHSTHSIDRFIHMLQEAKVERLVDVRRFPASRRFPHFNQQPLQQSLAQAGISYTHLTALAGRRNQSTHIQEEFNSGWHNQSFHNYADYTLTDTFKSGIQELITLAQTETVAYCCAERHPARCHRLLISNWLAANHWSVHHILDDATENAPLHTVPHHLGEWGAMPIIEQGGTVVYPPL